MQPSVIYAWHQFSEPLEGRVHHMYLDVKALVTTGVGNLVDPVTLALQLPWKHEDGSPATPAEVRTDFYAVKNRPELAKKHYKYAKPFLRLHLTDADIDALVAEKLAEFVAHMKRNHFPDFDSFPADAQLGICSMAWACGPGFPAQFKNFRAAVLAGDWLAAKAACKIRTDGNPGVVPRNRQNELCFDNAATVVDRGLDRSVLHWPNEAPRTGKAPIAPPLSDSDRARVLAQQFDHLDLNGDGAIDRDHDTEPPDQADTEPPPRNA